MNFRRVPLSDLNSVFERVDAFVCCASFEGRCLSVAQALDLSKCTTSLVACYDQRYGAVEKNLAQLRDECGSFVSDLSLSLSDPLISTDGIVDGFRSIFSRNPSVVVVDVSTFTHEVLMILYRVIPTIRSSMSAVYYLYTGANDYSLGDRHDRKWLSRGTREVRSVVGYPGNLFPSRSTHLVLLAGFEKERAIDLIREFEPSHVSLGYGDGSVMETRPHQKANEDAIEYIIQRAKSMANSVERFQFDPYSPLSAYKAIEAQVFAHSGMNTVVSPLNTKLSTIGAAQFAIVNESVQLCYAQPLIYNYDSYSTPKSDVWIVEEMLK